MPVMPQNDQFAFTIKIINSFIQEKNHVNGRSATNHSLDQLIKKLTLEKITSTHESNKVVNSKINQILGTYICH